MCGTRVLALLVLLVSSVRSFSWDIVVGEENRLEFYHNGTITHTEVIHSARMISSLTYDPVHYRLLFVDFDYPILSILIFNLSTEEIQCLVTRTIRSYFSRVVYDPVTQLLYWKHRHSIYSFSLNPASSNNTDENLLITTKHYCNDIAVDSCGGYIYWVTDYEIERARADGSEREVLIADYVCYRLKLAIDQQTQKIYWTERENFDDDYLSIESSNFNGNNRIRLYIVRNTIHIFSLAVSKDFIYWQSYNQEGIWQLPKNQTSHKASNLKTKSRTVFGECQRIVANYTIKEQIQGIKSCEALQDLLPNDSKSECTVSICQNYCIQGECSVSVEGQPTCSCKAGYTGERCEVNVCHDYCLHEGICSLNEDNKRVCLCTAGYNGERCDVSICNEYCLQGNCSVDADGQPKCSCMPGYSGKRCEENACYKHCLNGGICSLNEEDEPVCQCTAGYDGGRCEVSANKDDICEAGTSGEGTISACHQFCLNDGACSLNEASAPVCQCTADYVGERCDVPAFVVKWFLHAYKNIPQDALSDAVKSTRASTVV